MPAQALGRFGVWDSFSEGSRLAGSTMVRIGTVNLTLSLLLFLQGNRIHNKLQDGAVGLRLRVPHLERRLRLRRQNPWLYQGLQADL